MCEFETRINMYFGVLVRLFRIAQMCAALVGVFFNAWIVSTAQPHTIGPFLSMHTYRRRTASSLTLEFKLRSGINVVPGCAMNVPGFFLL